MIAIGKRKDERSFRDLNMLFRGMKTRFNACSGNGRPRCHGGFLVRHRNAVSVAIGAGKRSGLIEQNLLALHFLHQLVTIAAGDVLMSALEGESGLLVVEERGLPLVAVVAGGAVALPRGELAAMRIFMALAAGLWSFVEFHVKQGPLQVRRLVAIRAVHGPMRADKREFRCGVIEILHVVPILCGVAGFATQRFALGVALLHALGKLAVVDVLMTCGARKLGEMIEHNRIGGRRLMAVIAGDGHMPSG